MSSAPPPVVSDERALATLLAERDDAALARTFARRGVTPGVGWHDFFDAAAALLDPASIDRVLMTLPRTALVALAGEDASGPAVSDDVVLAQSGAPFAAVSARVTALRAESPDAFIAAEAPVDPAVGGEAAAAERAFTTSGSLADVLLTCLRAPLTRTGAGPVSAVDRKRLVEGGAVDSADELDDLIWMAEAARLVQASPSAWAVTSGGEEWLSAPTAERWRIVADGLRAALPDGLRDPSGRILPPDAWSAAYPLDPDWPARAAAVHRMIGRWGLLGDRAGTEPAWARAWRDGADAASELAAHLPPEIDRVYLQADLTAIAPGPLLPALDLRLRGIAVRESRAQASTYRFTAASLAAGMTDGETAGSIREFLSTLSLTGIPQPLDYLVESTAARHGLVTVREDAATGRTRVDSADAALGEAIAVDQALRPLGLVRDGDLLASRVGRDAVYWALADARYPVVALDGDGAPQAMHRRSSTVAPQVVDGSDRYARLIETLRGSHDADADAAWLGRELEQAVRARAAIVVDVRLPDGSQRSFALEASGLGGGRLRGLDRAADIERTLPVSSIVGVRPA